MSSGISNFNIKKSFVWKYGLSKLHKKKGGEDSDGGTTADETASCCSLEPDLDLQPQWEPLVAPSPAPSLAGDPAIPAKRRSAEPVSGASSAEAAAPPGYDVAGCRRVVVDGEHPIYETLSEYGGPLVAEDQHTLYENDDTDDDIGAPLYENGHLYATGEQPIYANGNLSSVEDEEPPIYENLSPEEQALAETASVQRRSSDPDYADLDSVDLGVPGGAAAGHGRGGLLQHLRVEVAADLGYDSYQSPSSGSPGSSPPRVSPNSDGVDHGAVESAESEAESEVERQRPRTVTQKPSSAPDDGEVVELRTRKAEGRPESQPASLSALISPESLINAKQALKQSRNLTTPRPSMFRPIKSKPKLGRLSLNSSVTCSSTEEKGEAVSEAAYQPLDFKTNHTAVTNRKNVKETGRNVIAEAINPVTSWVNRYPMISKAELPSEGTCPAYNTSFLHKDRTFEGQKDNVAFQMARKAIEQSLHIGRRQAVSEAKSDTAETSKDSNVTKKDLSSPVQTVAAAPGVIPPPPPLPGTATNQLPSSANIPPPPPPLPGTATNKLLSSADIPPPPPLPAPQADAKPPLDHATSPPSQPPASETALKPPLLNTPTSNTPKGSGSTEASAPNPLPSILSPPQSKQSSVAQTNSSESAIPPPPPLPMAPLFTTSPKLNPAAAKVTAPHVLQSGLKKKLELKKNSMATEKMTGKKKRRAPKPPDRSFSLPGYGSAGNDIVKAFEEYKKKEEKREKEAAAKKQKNSFLHDLDLRIIRKASSKVDEREKAAPCVQSMPSAALNKNTKYTKKKQLVRVQNDVGAGKQMTLPVCDSADDQTPKKVKQTNRKTFREIMSNTKEAVRRRLSHESEEPSFADVVQREKRATADAQRNRSGRINVGDHVLVDENVRDSSEITVLELIESTPPPTRALSATSDKPTPVMFGGSLTGPTSAVTLTSAGSSGLSAPAASAQPPCTSLPATITCDVTIGGLQLIHIKPESDSDEDAAAAGTQHRDVPFSLTVTTEPAGRAAAAAGGDRVALQVTHESPPATQRAAPAGRSSAPPRAGEHTSVVAVEASVSRVRLGQEVEPRTPAATQQATVVVRHGPPADRSSYSSHQSTVHDSYPAENETLVKWGIDAEPPPQCGDVLWQGAAMPGRSVIVSRRSSGEEAHHHQPRSLVIPVSDAERQSGGQTARRAAPQQVVWSRQRCPSPAEVESGQRRLEQERRRSVDVLRQQLVEDECRRQRRQGCSSTAFSRLSDFTATTPTSVEALSILANKERTKHFLEQRIQADLSAAASSPSSPALSSKMSAPVALSPPAGFADDVAGAGEPAGAEFGECDLDWRLRPGRSEVLIAHEIAELRRREEELRRLHTQAATAAVTRVAGQLSPASQEEPPSGYGSEDKESLAEDTDSAGRPGPAAAAAGGSLSRSRESLSSGHSSGGRSSGLGWEPPEPAGRRRATVRPYEDQEEGRACNNFTRSTETPIEREIRLAREREEERRREQAQRTPLTLSHGAEKRHPTQNGAHGRSGPQSPLVSGPRQVVLRLATNRVQHEIEEATRRELELREEGKAITTSEETVDDKVTRPLDLVDMRRERHEPALRQPAVRPAAEAPRPAADAGSRPAARGRPELARLTSEQTAAGRATGRGLMQKFIASRGRLRPVGAFVASLAPVRSPPRAAAAPPAQGRPPVGGRGPPAGPAATNGYSRQAERQGAVRRAGESRPSPDRPSATSRRPASQQPTMRRLLSAEEKIQQELLQMKQREDELRRERSWALARSQPDLLAALEAAESFCGDEEQHELPAAAPLVRTRSIPSLLDDHSLQTSAPVANGRRRSTLIDQWESRIQGAEA